MFSGDTAENGLIFLYPDLGRVSPLSRIPSREWGGRQGATGFSVRNGVRVANSGKGARHWGSPL